MQDSSRPITGYPYPNPYPNPPPSSVPVNGYPPSHAGAYPYMYAPPQNNSRAVLCRRLFIICTGFLLVMGFALFIIFLIVRPHLPDVSLKSLSVSGFNVSNNMVAGRWDLQFQFRNPNSKISLYFYELDCSVYYHEALLSDSRLPPFGQGKKDQTTVNATLSVASNYLKGSLVDSINKDKAAPGRVEFDVKIVSYAGFRYGAFRRRRYVTAFCNNVAVDVSANSNSGKMIAPVTGCKVY